MIDYFIFQLAIIFIPGLLWQKMDQSFGEKKKRTHFDRIITIFLFGVIVYIAEGGIFYICNQDFAIFNLTNERNSWKMNELLLEIAWSIPIGFVLSIFWLWITRYRLILRFLNRIGASNSLAQDDVWTSGMNGVFGECKSVRVVNFKDGKLIEGQIQAFSEIEDIRELWMVDVIVSDLEGNIVNEIPKFYLSLRKDEVWLEFPTKKGDEK